VLQYTDTDTLENEIRRFCGSVASFLDWVDEDGRDPGDVSAELAQFSTRASELGSVATALNEAGAGLAAPIEAAR
jgi:hypothetical protein